MKLLKKTPLLLLFATLVGGCHNDGIPPGLVGDWLWEVSSGGISGMLSKPQPTQRVVLTFSDNGQFSMRQNDTLAYTGTFELTTARSIYSGKDGLTIKTNQLLTGYHRKIPSIIVIDGIVSQLSSTQLCISDNRYDGFGSCFVRK